MKLSVAIILSAAGVTQAWVAPNAAVRPTTSLNGGVVYYSTSTGNTQTIAGYIADAAGCGDAEDIGDASESDVSGQDFLIVGAPTWHTDAEEQRSGTAWDDWLYDTLPNLDLSGKKVAIFGCGDQESYSDYYCDAAGELYDKFTESGCKVYGMTSTKGYNHQASKAEVDGKFVGMMCDEDNQYDKSEDRANAWVAQLKDE